MIWLLGCTSADPGPCALARTGDWVAAVTLLDDLPLEIVADGDRLATQSSAVVLGGGFEATQVPSTGAERLPAGDGLVQIRTDLPADLFGADSRARVAAVLQYAAGLATDEDGCTLEDRTPTDGVVLLVGESNGGNLAVSALAEDPALPVDGLVTWETPAGPQFVLNELVLPETGACHLDAGLTCEVDFTQLDWDGRPWLDRDGDGVRGDEEPVFEGLALPDGRLHSPTLLRALGDRAGTLDADAATAWFAWREASHLAPRVETPAIILGSPDDHAQVLPDSPHVVGLAAAMGGWVRLNPDSDYTGVAVENDAGAGLDLTAPGALVELDKRLLIAAATLELAERVREDDWSPDR